MIFIKVEYLLTKQKVKEIKRKIVITTYFFR